MNTLQTNQMSRTAITLFALLFAAVLLACIPQGQAFAADAAADTPVSADQQLVEYTAMVGQNSQASIPASIGESTVQKAGGIKSAYGLLMSDGYIYPCSKTGKKLGKYWNIGSTVTYLYVAANCTKVPKSYKTYYRASIKLSNPISIKLKIVNFKTSGNKSSVKYLATSAFRGAIHLVAVKNFSKTKVEKIPEGAFAGTALEKIGLPKTLKYICKEAFYNDKKLLYVSGLGKTNVSAIGVSAFENAGVKTLAMPKTLTTIKNDVFYNTPNLTKVTGLQNTKIKAIPDYAFYKAKKLTAIALPKTCKKVGKYAFAQCTNLKKLYLLSPTRVTGGYYMLAASGIAKGASGAAIYVPSALYMEYYLDISLSHANWGDYNKYLKKR